MRSWLYFLILSMLPWGPTTTTSVDLPLSLIPAPQSYRAEVGIWRPSASLRLCIETTFDGPDPVGEERVAFAIRRLLHHAYPSQTTVVKRDCQDADLRVQWQIPTQKVPELGNDEAYALDINESGVTLQATMVSGILPGLQSLEGLLEGVRETRPFIRAAHLVDSPRFAWRGLLLDVARTYLPVPVILRTLDAMAAVKLNVLHWHLTDDQGFRVECLRYPRLHELGSGGLYYTHADIRLIVDYAANLGIRVVPEFDVPGHTASWLVAYPELASGPAPSVVPDAWGILSDTLDPTREETYQFLDGFLTEMAALFDDSFVHLGGDEVDMSAWKHNAALTERQRAWSVDTPQALHALFLRRVSELVASHRKRVVGWDEILQPNLPSSTVIQSWSGPDGLAKAAKLGHASLLSYGFYLNLPVPLRAMYENDPAVALMDGTHANMSLLGGEACMWTELVGPENIDRIIWPRAAAVAERLWSAADRTDVEDFLRRVPALETRLARLGIDAYQAQRAQLAHLLPADTIEPVMAMLPFLQSVQQNWYEGFRQRRELSTLADVAPVAPGIEEQLVLAQQRQQSASGATRRAAQQEIRALALSAQAAANAVLRDSVFASNGNSQALWMDVQLAARALLERTDTLLNERQGQAPLALPKASPLSAAALQQRGLSTVFDVLVPSAD